MRVTVEAFTVVLSLAVTGRGESLGPKSHQAGVREGHNGEACGEASPTNQHESRRSRGEQRDLRAAAKGRRHAAAVHDSDPEDGHRQRKGEHGYQPEGSVRDAAPRGVPNRGEQGHLDTEADGEVGVLEYVEHRNSLGGSDLALSKFLATGRA